MNNISLTEVRNLVIIAAIEAGEIAKTYFYSKEYTSQSKGGKDFVTQADLEVDQFLKAKLQKEYPDTSFLTEETAPKDFSNLVETHNLWVIDPIDGTTNFSRGDEHFAISIALVDKGVAKLGVVYLPIENRLYYAQADLENAYCNDKVIHVSALNDLTSASVGYDWSWDMDSRKKTIVWLEKYLTAVRQPRSLGSAAADLAMIADGRLDVYCNAGLNPWDVAGSSIILEKAGGKISKPDGDKWNIFDRDILATNSLIHEKILKLLE